MWIPDMPNVPPQNAPVLIAQANQAQANDTSTIRTIGVCFPAPNDNYTLENVVEPIAAAGIYLRSYEHQQVQNIGTVTVLQQPKHGILRRVTEADRGILFSSTSGPADPNNPGYAYLPEQGYLGNDKAVMLVEIAGGKVKVVYFFQAVEGPLGNYGTQDYCSKTGVFWKISSTLGADGNSTITGIDYLPPYLSTAGTTLTSDSLDSWLSLAQLDSKIADMSDINVTVAAPRVLLSARPPERSAGSGLAFQHFRALNLAETTISPVPRHAHKPYAMNCKFRQ